MSMGLYLIQNVEYCGYFKFKNAPKAYHNYHTDGKSIYPIMAKYRVTTPDGVIMVVEVPKKSKRGEYILFDLDGHRLCTTRFSLGSLHLDMSFTAFSKAVNATLKYDHKNELETEHWFQTH